MPKEEFNRGQVVALTKNIYPEDVAFGYKKALVYNGAIIDNCRQSGDIYHPPIQEWQESLCFETECCDGRLRLFMM